MEYVIRINDSAGEGEPEPISLRLPPGGGDEIRLRVVNLGEPTNLVVKTDQSVIRYVKPEKVNHYIVLEETIPISVRMPEAAEMVTGELLLITDTTTKKIPVTLEADGVYRDESGDVDEDLRKNESRGGYSDRYDAEAGQPIFRSSENPRDPHDDYDDECDAEAEDRDGQSYEDYYKNDQYYRHESRTGESIERYEPATGCGIYCIDLIPVALILAATIILMVLTFHTKTLPLFAGALATSMMIVSLIIYGTATLLRS